MVKTDGQLNEVPNESLPSSKKRTEGTAQIGFSERPPLFVVYLAFFAAILFIAASPIFAFQALRNVPVYGTSGGMHQFVESIEQQLSGAEELVVNEDPSELLEPRLRAFERFGILTARDFLRQYRTNGLKDLELISYIETEGAMASFCNAKQDVPDCIPEPGCVQYREWASKMDLASLTGAMQQIRNEEAGANGSFQPQPGARALLGCSQRGLQVLANFSRNESSKQDQVVSTAIRNISIRYPGVNAENWPQVLAFIDSYRTLVPKNSIAGSENAKDKFFQPLVQFLATIWGSVWLLFLWPPLFLIYILLAGCCGAISNVVRAHISHVRTGEVHRLALEGGAAAWFGVMLIMVGFTLTGVAGVVLNKIPEPSVVVVISFIAGLNATAIISKLGTVANTFFKTPETASPGH